MSEPLLGAGQQRRFRLANIAGSHSNQRQPNWIVELAPRNTLAWTENPSIAARLLPGMGPGERIASVSTRPAVVDIFSIERLGCCVTQAIAASSECCSSTSYVPSRASQFAGKPSTRHRSIRHAIPTHQTDRPPAAGAPPWMIDGLFCRPRREAGSHEPDREVRRQFDERYIRCLSDMPKRAAEFVGTPHVDNERGVILLKPRRAPLAQSMTAPSAGVETSETAAS